MLAQVVNILRTKKKQKSFDFRWPRNSSNKKRFAWCYRCKEKRIYSFRGKYGKNFLLFSRTLFQIARTNICAFSLSINFNRIWTFTKWQSQNCAKKERIVLIRYAFTRYTLLKYAFLNCECNVRHNVALVLSVCVEFDLIWAKWCSSYNLFR